MSGYAQSLAKARRVGAANADDAGVMALFCDGALQQLVGAVSPELVWQGAQAKGLTARELARMAAFDVMSVSDLQWVADA